jgi:hypothetical protein
VESSSGWTNPRTTRPNGAELGRASSSILSQNSMHIRYPLTSPNRPQANLMQQNSKSIHPSVALSLPIMSEREE